MSDAKRTRRGDAAPAEELADVFGLLDALPRGTASAGLAASTIETVAVAAEKAAAAPAFQARRWLGPAAVVAAALAAGVLAGRLTAPDPDRTLLERLPLVRHLDLLREAGSVRFLTGVAERGLPRPGGRPGIEARRPDSGDYAKRLESLRDLLRADTAARRRAVAEMSVDERAGIERGLREFAALSPAEQETLTEVAEALVDPQHKNLEKAAQDWHRLLAVLPPDVRDELVDSTTEGRIERIEWYERRLDGRFRPGDPDGPPNARRPPGGEWPRGPDARGRRPPPVRPGEEPRPGGPPRDAPPRPFSPDRPPPPPETRAPRD